MRIHLTNISKIVSEKFSAEYSENSAFIALKVVKKLYTAFHPGSANSFFL